MRDRLLKWVEFTRRIEPGWKVACLLLAVAVLLDAVLSGGKGLMTLLWNFIPFIFLGLVAYVGWNLFYRNNMLDGSLEKLAGGVGRKRQLTPDGMVVLKQEVMKPGTALNIMPMVVVTSGLFVLFPLADILNGGGVQPLTIVVTGFAWLAVFLVFGLRPYLLGKLTFTVSEAEVRPGQRIRLRLALNRRRGVDKLAVTLVCRETCRAMIVRVMKDENRPSMSELIHAPREFGSYVLSEVTREIPVVQRGRFSTKIKETFVDEEFVIPADCTHSFAARRNRIDWLFRVSITSEDNPDLDVQFPILIRG